MILIPKLKIVRTLRLNHNPYLISSKQMKTHLSQIPANRLKEKERKNQKL